MLPLILAGPIVRRVDANLCSVWIALSQAMEVKLWLWAGRQHSAGPGAVKTGDTPLATAAADTRRFGQNLHIAVVTIDLTPPAIGAQPPPPAIALPPGAIVSYDLVVGGKNLRDLKLLENEDHLARLDGVHPDAPLHLALGYETDALPSFATVPVQLDRLRVAHASCRKANYTGYDAMAWLDDWIRKEVEIGSAAERPQQLFLTGDQIYGDDVAASLLPMLTGLGTELLGKAETIAFAPGETVELTGTSFPPLRRGKFVRGTLKLSTTESANHLLGFGEYAAMYLAAWSSRVWRALGDDVAMFVPRDHPRTKNVLTDWEACHGGSFDTWRTEEKKEQAKKKDREGTEAYRAAVPKAARALANCVTYMIWDDHEVTDDWNLSGLWVSRVHAAEPGRQFIRNGMIAYGVFQGWGNDPDRFAAGPNKNFLDGAAACAPAAGGFHATAQMDEMLGLTAALPSARVKWAYRIDSPVHRTIVLDTRTRRDTGSAMSTRAPKLLGDTLAEQVPDGPLADGRTLLMLVSPAPVLGPTIFDSAFQPLASAGTDIAGMIKKRMKGADELKACKPVLQQLQLTDGDMATDLEGWGADEEEREALLKKLAPYQTVVILSGDVHYSATLDMDYWRKGANEPSRIIQLTCSGARNGWPLKIESQFRKNTVFQDLLRGVLVERVAWTGAAQLTVPAGKHIGPGRRARMFREPSLLPTINWPQGTSVTADPDWRWRVRLVRDERTGGLNDAPADPPPVAGNHPEGSFEHYAAVLARHQQATMTMPRLLRTLSFLPSVGLVSIGIDGKSLIHTMLSATAPDAQTFARNTLHVVGLEPTEAAPPTLQTG